jgi:hypothetical protein
MCPSKKKKNHWRSIVPRRPFRKRRGLTKVICLRTACTLGHFKTKIANPNWLNQAHTKVGHFDKATDYLITIISLTFARSSKRIASTSTHYKTTSKKWTVPRKSIDSQPKKGTETYSDLIGVRFNKSKAYNIWRDVIQPFPLQDIH